MTTVSAIVPTWNRADLLRRLLESLQAQEPAIDEVLVVDNGSTDNTRSIAKQFGARIVPLDRNFGFAYAVNRGIEASRGEWVAILNNDVVLRPDWLKELLAANAPFACGMILDESDPSRIDGTFDLVLSSGLAWRAGAGQPAADPRWQIPREITSAPMTAALFRRSLFDRVGSLDESFGSYLEDVDFGIRCAQAGLRGRYVPTALATHQGSATLGAWRPETVRLLARNQILFIAKHYPASWIWHYGCSAVAGQLLWGFAAIRHGQHRAWFRGKREGLAAWGLRVPGSGRASQFFRDNSRLIKEFAPGWFWKVNAWIS